MARPAGVNSEDTRDAIVDGALRVFARDGFAAAPLGDIAAHAGITKGAIYWHFPSKDALFRGVIDRIGRRFREHVLKPALARDTAAERLETMVRAYVSFVRQNPAVCRFLVQALLDGEPRRRAAAERVFAQSSGVVAAMLDEAGAPFVTSADALADAFLAGLLGARVVGDADESDRTRAIFAELEAQMLRRLSGVTEGS